MSRYQNANAVGSAATNSAYQNQTQVIFKSRIPMKSPQSGERKGLQGMVQGKAAMESAQPVD